MPRWNLEARKKQRQLILETKPWEKSTGPKSPEGKLKASRNSLKLGLYSQGMKEIKAALSELKNLQKEFLDFFGKD